MIGRRFTRLVVVEAAGRDKKRNLLWRCKCDCGADALIAGYRLRNGETRSCGCLQREVVTIRNTSHNQSSSRLYNIWSNMLARCQNENNPQFDDYGGRGITVCPEWHDFSTFAAWAAVAGYSSNLTIDRIDNDSGYAPRNCRWATRLQQSRNKRPRRDQKLTDAQVNSIRADRRPNAVIASEYSIHPHYVSRLKGGIRRAFPTGETHHA